MLIEEWKQFAISENYKYLLIVKDLEDGELFPVYFHTESKVKEYCNNIISESKLKVINLIKNETS
jgi:hypothetical protein